MGGNIPGKGDISMVSPIPLYLSMRLHVYDGFTGCSVSYDKHCLFSGSRNNIHNISKYLRMRMSKLEPPFEGEVGIGEAPFENAL